MGQFGLRLLHVVRGEFPSSPDPDYLLRSSSPCVLRRLPIREGRKLHIASPHLQLTIKVKVISHTEMVSHISIRLAVGIHTGSVCIDLSPVSANLQDITLLAKMCSLSPTQLIGHVSVRYQLEHLTPRREAPFIRAIFQLLAGVSIVLGRRHALRPSLTPLNRSCGGGVSMELHRQLYLSSSIPLQ